MATMFLKSKEETLARVFSTYTDFLNEFLVDDLVINFIVRRGPIEIIKTEVDNDTYLVGGRTLKIAIRQKDLGQKDGGLEYYLTVVMADDSENVVCNARILILERWIRKCGGVVIRDIMERIWNLIQTLN